MIKKIHRYFFIFFAGLLILAGCNEPLPKKEATVLRSIESEGVSISYTDSQSGDTTLLFVHGWNIDKGYWSEQVSHFSGKYRVVTIDLPGYGKSGKNRSSWTVENYGADINKVIELLKLTNVIVIGHSMSGNIVVEAALRNPEKIIGIVTVDAIKNYGTVISPETREAIAQAYQSLRSNYHETVREYVNQSLFSVTTDSLVRKRVLDDFMNADSTLSVNILEEGDKYSMDDHLKLLQRPVFLINSSKDPTDTSSFKNAGIRYVLLDIGPTGHYPMIEKPAAFNELLERAIKQVNR